MFYTLYHILYGKFSLSSYLISNFNNKLLDLKIEKTNTMIKMIDEDLNALYTGKKDFLDEILKKKNIELDRDGVLLKLN